MGRNRFIQHAPDPTELKTSKALEGSLNGIKCHVIPCSTIKSP